MKYISNIDYFRNRIGMTVVELSAKTGLSRGFINEVKRGDKQPSIDSLNIIAKALNTTAAKLIDGDLDKNIINSSTDELRQFDVAIIDVFKMLFDSIISGKYTSAESFKEILATQENRYRRSSLMGGIPLIDSLKVHVAGSSQIKSVQIKMQPKEPAQTEFHE